MYNNEEPKHLDKKGIGTVILQGASFVPGSDIVYCILYIL